MYLNLTLYRDVAGRLFFGMFEERSDGLGSCFALGRLMMPFLPPRKTAFLFLVLLPRPRNCFVVSMMMSLYGRLRSWAFYFVDSAHGGGVVV